MVRRPGDLEIQLPALATLICNRPGGSTWTADGSVASRLARFILTGLLQCLLDLLAQIPHRFLRTISDGALSVLRIWYQCLGFHGHYGPERGHGHRRGLSSRLDIVGRFHVHPFAA